MSIPVDCPGCRAHYEAPEKFAGHRMKCKACGTVLTVPAGELELLDDVAPAPAPAARQAARPAATAAPAAKRPTASKPVAPQTAARPPAPGPAPLDNLLDDVLVGSQGKTLDRGARRAACPECGGPMAESGTCTECGHAVKKKKKKAKGAGAPSGGLPSGLSQVFIIDIVLCLIYYGGISAVLLAVQGRHGLDSGSQTVATILGGILVFALVANGSMLAGKQWGWMLGYGLMGITALGIMATAFSQVASSGTPLGGAVQYNVGRIIGVLIASLIRFAILKWYYEGVQKFRDWATGRRPSRESD